MKKMEKFADAFANADDFRPAKKRVEVSVGESIRIMRELQELSQQQLAELTGIPANTLAAIESGRVRVGIERAKTLARALQCHPAVLVFPGWEITLPSFSMNLPMHHPFPA